MTVHTLVVSIVIPDATYSTDGVRTEPKPAATVIWPSGEIQRITLADHDWSADTWDWRGGYLPQSFLRWFRDQWLALNPVIHGSRATYVSPADTGAGTNEQGRLMVFELDYEAV